LARCPDVYEGVGTPEDVMLVAFATMSSWLAGIGRKGLA
jgi:hypothetical protein